MTIAATAIFVNASVYSSTFSQFMGLESSETGASSQNNESSKTNAISLQSQSILSAPAASSSTIVQAASGMFGEQLFRGAFASTSGSTFNESYAISPGDNVQLRMWGAYQFSGNLTVDPQGNIFIPNVGPVHLAGINNGALQNTVEQRVRQVYRANVGVYAALETAQLVKVFVTGFVMQPGYYGGVSADSVLSYLDRAGGVDPKRGSYVDVQIRRNGTIKQKINLYDFLLAGNLQPFSFRDGDVVVVAPRKYTFSVIGEVYNAFDFEFDVDQLTVERALTVARLKPGATHISINRRQGTEFRSEYYPIAQAGLVVLQDGDSLNVTSDRFAGTIQVRIEGAHDGQQAIVLPYGSKLSQVLQQIKPNKLSQVNHLQLFRQSVALRQQEMLNISLDKLEEATYSVRSSTKEEAGLRAQDAQLIKQFVEKARKIQPKGQVVVSPDQADSIILEDGDVIRIPEQTSVIMVHGEVTFPNALTWRDGLRASDYIDQVGGYTQSSNKSRLVLIRQNGEAELVRPSTQVLQGDEIMVLPKVQTKHIEIARGLTAVLFQIAIATKTILDL